jgi:hypothetical protein
MLKNVLGLFHIFFFYLAFVPIGAFSEVFCFLKFFQMYLVFLFFIWQVLGFWTRHYSAWDDHP